MIKNLTSVKGFTCWGAHTGVKSMRRDLAIIFSEVPASAAATFTQNQVVAEPIKVSRKNIENGKAQAIIVNAGNANACTGQQGKEGAEAMVKAAAEELKIDEDLVLVASTGLIGEPFPTEDVVKGIRENITKLSNKSNAGSFAANAILTTDTFPKEGHLEFEVDDVEINLAGIAKGSGMIHPNMGTMLSFIVCDIAITPKLLDKAVKEAVDKSFNMITVDGDTSTNDMVAVLCNGMAKNSEIKSANSADYKKFKEKLEEIMIHLAQLIVSDGEGCSKFVTYEVVNAPDEQMGRKLIREVSDSTLVKTAMFGRDPNWGRIMCAAGNAGVPFEFEKTDLYLGSDKETILVLKQGVPQEFDRNNMKRILRHSQIKIIIDLNAGDEKAVGWGSDLTTDYVMFNSVYTT